MLRIIMFTVGVIIGSAACGPLESQELQEPSGQRDATPAKPESPRLQLNYTAVARLSEETRKALFADLSACRADVQKKADVQYPEMKLQSPGYDPKEDMKRFRERSRFEDAGTLECNRRTMETHSIDALELHSIAIEGVCRQWPPLSGKPQC